VAPCCGSSEYSQIEIQVAANYRFAGLVQEHQLGKVAQMDSWAKPSSAIDADLGLASGNARPLGAVATREPTTFLYKAPQMTLAPYPLQIQWNARTSALYQLPLSHSLRVLSFPKACLDGNGDLRLQSCIFSVSNRPQVQTLDVIETKERWMSYHICEEK
jgi:hypothetical protein